MTTTDSTTAPAAVRGASRASVPGGLVAALLGTLALAASNVCFAILTADGHAEDTSDHLDLVRDHTAVVEIGSGLGLLASVLIVPAVWALVTRLSDQRPRLAASGGWLMSSGYVAAVFLAADSLLSVSVVRATGSTATYVDAIDQQTTVAATAAYGLFGLGALVGGLVLGIAMLRHTAVPRWCGLAVIASEPVRVVGLLTGVDLLTAVASVLLLVGFVGTLRRR